MTTCIVETVFSMMSVVWRTKEMPRRVWDSLEAHLAYTMSASNILAQRNGLQPDAQGRILVSIAQFTL